MIVSRGFRTSAARLSSPYHYPEGPLSGIPFNPRTKYFAIRYWGTMGMRQESASENQLANMRQLSSLVFHSALLVGFAAR